MSMYTYTGNLQSDNMRLIYWFPKFGDPLKFKPHISEMSGNTNKFLWNLEAYYTHAK